MQDTNSMSVEHPKTDQRSFQMRQQCFDTGFLTASI